MEKKRSNVYKVAGAMTLIVLAFVFGYSFSLTPTQVSDSMTAAGHGYLQIDRVDGTTEIHPFANTVTNIAKNQTRDVLSGLGTNAEAHAQVNNTLWLWLQLSTDSSAAAATDAVCPSAITGNGLDVARGNSSRNTATVGNFSVSNRWTATGTQASIYKVCMQNWTLTNSPLMASALIPGGPYTVNANDNATIVYYVSVA